MFEKLEELAKNNKKISDFHLRSGSTMAYRQTGEIVKVKEIKPEGKNIMSGEEFLRGRTHLINTSLT